MDAKSAAFETLELLNLETSGSGFLTLGVSCTKSLENAPKGTCL